MFSYLKLSRNDSRRLSTNANLDEKHDAENAVFLTEFSKERMRSTVVCHGFKRYNKEIRLFQDRQQHTANTVHRWVGSRPRQSQRDPAPEQTRAVALSREPIMNGRPGPFMIKYFKNSNSI